MMQPHVFVGQLKVPNNNTKKNYIPKRSLVERYGLDEVNVPCPHHFCNLRYSYSFYIHSCSSCNTFQLWSKNNNYTIYIYIYINFPISKKSINRENIIINSEEYKTIGLSCDHTYSFKHLEALQVQHISWILLGLNLNNIH